MFSQYPEDTREVLHVFGHHFTFHNHIIDINFNTSTQLRFKHFRHHTLVGRSSIFQAEGHHLVMVVPNQGYKSSLFLIVDGQRYLVIPLEGIQETHPRVTHGRIHQLVDFWHAKWILGASLIEIREVHAHPPFSSLLFYYYRIGQLLRIKNFLDSPSLFELGNFASNRLGVFPRWSPRRLPPGHNGRVHVESMTNEIRVHPCFIRVPCENIHIGSEELQQPRLFLQRQFSPNLEEFFRIASNNYLLQIFTLYPIGWYVQA